METIENCIVLSFCETKSTQPFLKGRLFYYGDSNVILKLMIIQSNPNRSYTLKLTNNKKPLKSYIGIYRG